MAPKITVYTSPGCGQCDMTKHWLNGTRYRKGDPIEFEVVDLSTDKLAMDAVKALGYASAPVVLVNIDGDTKNEMHWYGFRKDMLEQFCLPTAAPVAA